MRILLKLAIGCGATAILVLAMVLGGGAHAADRIEELSPAQVKAEALRRDAEVMQSCATLRCQILRAVRLATARDDHHEIYCRELHARGRICVVDNTAPPE